MGVNVSALEHVGGMSVRRESECAVAKIVFAAAKVELHVGKRMAQVWV